MLRGIDISNNNWRYLSGLNFQPLLFSDFVIMKASEGKTYKDTALDYYYNLFSGSDSGRPVYDRLYGFYHYARPENGNSAQNEANNFLRLVRHHAGHCIYALDVEGSALKLSYNYLDSWTAEWCQHVYNDTGVRPLIYCSIAEAARFKTAAAIDCGLWVASWAKKPTKKNIFPWSVWAIWQDGTTAGKLDTDFFNGSAEQFIKYTERG